MNKDDEITDMRDSTVLTSELVEKDQDQDHEVIIKDLIERIAQLVEQHALERGKLSSTISRLQEENNALRMRQGTDLIKNINLDICFDFTETDVDNLG